jgi:tetratricopeptide (TPR) repeat protein
MVSFGKSDREKAEDDFNKAEERYEALRFEKAGKYYSSAGETYFEIQDFKFAENSFLNSAKSYIEEELYEDVLEALRMATNASLKLGKHDYANEIVQKALGYVKKIESKKKRNKYFILFSTLSYFCYFIKGEPKKGLQLVKKMQQGVDKDFFKKHQLIHIITNITIALRDKNDIYIEKIKEQINDIKLNKSEMELIQKVLLLASIQTVITPKISLNQEEYTTNDLIEVNIKTEGNSIGSIIENNINSLEIKEISLIKGTVGHSDNLTVKQKPDFPLDLSLKNGININYLLKPHFLKDETIIGPVTLTGRIDGIYQFYIENRKEFPVMLLSPPTHLDMTVDSLKPPLIEKTFPLEILIENNSESEARNLEITLTLPENLKLMRGTLEKQIYSLRPNETIEWQISAKPKKAEEAEIIAELKYTDPDQNTIEEKKAFTISIKL